MHIYECVRVCVNVGGARIPVFRKCKVRRCYLAFPFTMLAINEGLSSLDLLHYILIADFARSP